MRLGPEHPACMDAETDRLWWQAERVRWSVGGRPAKHDASPCDDCERAFAEAMRAEGRCDGHYPGEEVLDRYRLAARRETWRQSSRKRREAMAL